MTVNPTQEVHAPARGRGATASLDSGARLSRALLSYVVVLIASLLLLPFEFAVPDVLALRTDASPLRALATFALFVPYGFLSSRARTSRVGQHVILVSLSAAMLALALETAQLFIPATEASVWHLVAAIAGATAGAAGCSWLHSGSRSGQSAVHALLVQLPLMGLSYLLLPLLWASTAAARGDAPRLALTICAGLAGASLLGSIARATRAYTPDRSWWSVPLVGLAWATVGLLPGAVMVDWRIACGGIVAITLFTAIRGRWRAPMFKERRYEGAALLAASPFLVLYFIGAGVWPGQIFRSVPLISVGMPTSEEGLALVLPLLEMGIAATVLGYLIAESLGRRESAFRDAIPRVVGWSCLLLLAAEAARAFFGYEGASLLRAALSLFGAVYGAGLYHLQRAHVKVVAQQQRFAG